MAKLLGKPRPIDSRNRISLPSEVIKHLNLRPGDQVFFKINESKIIMGKALVKYEFIDEIISKKKK